MIEGVYSAKCGCQWSLGSWDICDRHRKPNHADHAADPCPWCDLCAIPFIDDLEDCVPEKPEFFHPENYV